MTWARGSTRRSRRQRDVVLKTWPICHIQGPNCTIESTQDDHVIPLSQGGTDALDNHRGACATCHREKSQRESLVNRKTRARPTEQSPGLISDVRYPGR